MHRNRPEILQELQRRQHDCRAGLKLKAEKRKQACCSGDHHGQRMVSGKQDGQKDL